jgi:hypothetical protein
VPIIRKRAVVRLVPLEKLFAGCFKEYVFDLVQPEPILGLSHKAALLDLARKYNVAVDNYNSNRRAPSRNNERAAMQDAEKLATDKRDETVDAFARAAAIGGEAGQQAQNELRKLFTGTQEELNKHIQDKKSQLPD